MAAWRAGSVSYTATSCTSGLSTSCRTARAPDRAGSDDEGSHQRAEVRA